MKKILFLCIACLFILTSNIKAQIIYQEDFEELNINQGIAAQHDRWVSWLNNANIDPKVTNSKSKSGTKSLHIKRNDDPILLLDDVTTGSYSLEFQASVTSDNYAHIMILQKFVNQDNVFSIPGVSFIFIDEKLVIAGNGTAKEVEGITYNSNIWIAIKTIIDLDKDKISIYVNNHLAQEYKWSNGASNNGNGIKAIAGINFGGDDFTFEGEEFISDYYIDDIKFEKLPSSTSINDLTNTLEFSIYPNPAVDLLNIESSSVIDKLEILSVDGKLINSFNVNNTRLECNTKDLVKGFYILRIYQDNKITNKHFVVQ